MRHCCLIHLPYFLTDVMFVCEPDVDIGQYRVYIRFANEHNVSKEFTCEFK